MQSIQKEHGLDDFQKVKKESVLEMVSSLAKVCAPDEACLPAFGSLSQLPGAPVTHAEDTNVYSLSPPLLPPAHLIAESAQDRDCSARNGCKYLRFCHCNLQLSAP